MTYLSSFTLTTETSKNPNLYPFGLFAQRSGDSFRFEQVTMFTGSNGYGKSTLLNLIATILSLKGRESAGTHIPSFSRYASGCKISTSKKISPQSRYIKSEDILHQVKIAQDSEVLREDYIVARIKKNYENSDNKSDIPTNKRLKILQFAQEKYSNGQTTMRFFEDVLEPDGLYLLDEPEVSLSPENQLKLAESFNVLAHRLGCQLIIVTHSPFILGTVDGLVYDLDKNGTESIPWFKVQNMKEYASFFKEKAYLF